jgi:hypothetical protein
MCHGVICGLSGCLVNGMIFGEKEVDGREMCFDFLYSLWPKHFPF